MSDSTQVQLIHSTMQKQHISLLDWITVSVWDGLEVSLNALIPEDITREKNQITQETSCRGIIVSRSQKVRKLHQGVGWDSGYSYC